jgi:hypothetical protein
MSAYLNMMRRTARVLVGSGVLAALALVAFLTAAPAPWAVVVGWVAFILFVVTTFALFIFVGDYIWVRLPGRWHGGTQAAILKTVCVLVILAPGWFLLRKLFDKLLAL